MSVKYNYCYYNIYIFFFMKLNTHIKNNYTNYYTDKYLLVSHIFKNFFFIYYYLLLPGITGQQIKFKYIKR